MIKLENVSVSFGGYKVIDNLSCAVNDNDFISIVGANGAGKTTFFDLISGKVKASSGKIFLNNEDITGLSERERAPRISRLFQNTYLGCVSSMTIRENLALAMFKNKNSGLKSGISNFPVAVIEEIIKPLNMGLEKMMDTPMGLLSGGQRQMIAFIMATLIKPKILLLDEPTAALDPASATKLLIFVNEFVRSNKITTLLITHDPNVALVLGNRLWVLEKGTIKKEFGAEKADLSPDHLIGHIDYKKLK